MCDAGAAAARLKLRTVFGATVDVTIGPVLEFCAFEDPHVPALHLCAIQDSSSARRVFLGSERCEAVGPGCLHHIRHATSFEQGRFGENAACQNL